MEANYLKQVDFFTAVAVVNRAKLMGDDATVEFICTKRDDSEKICSYYLKNIAAKP